MIGQNGSGEACNLNRWDAFIDPLNQLCDVTV